MTVALVRSESLYAWKGPSLVILTPSGDCGEEHPLSGYYSREARFLRTLRLEINGERLWLCEAAAVAPDALHFSYVHPEHIAPGGGGTAPAGDEEQAGTDGIPQRALDVRVAYVVHVAHLAVVLSITNHSRRTVEFDPAWTLDADFADIQEAQSGERQQQAKVDTEEHGPTLEFVYHHPQLPYRTAVHLPDASWRRVRNRVSSPNRGARRCPACCRRSA